MSKILRKTSLNQQHEANLGKNKLRWVTYRFKSRVNNFVVLRAYGSFMKAFQAKNSRLEQSQLSNNNKLVLSEDDSKLFISVMENPPQPCESLISLFD
ncbi:MAG: hypothetical protein QNJ47_04165 [Nostocaceae cyanobacterium]|nr:hypothetical protein [Nostocaceae cyanobacterium]